MKHHKHEQTIRKDKSKDEVTQPIQTEHALDFTWWMCAEKRTLHTLQRHWEAAARPHDLATNIFDIFVSQNICAIDENKSST